MTKATTIRGLVVWTTTLLVFGMLAAAGIGVAAAAPSVSINPAETTGLSPGSTFSIDVLVDSDASAMRAVEVYLNYDSDVLQVNSVDDGDLFDPFMKVCDYGTPGVVEYAMVDTGGAPYAAAAGTLMTVNFEVKGSAPDGTSDITLPFVLLKDENKDEITGVGVTPGTVTVGATTPATVKVSPQEMTGLCPGELFAIDVVVNSGTSPMRAAEVYLNYDSDVLQVNSVDDGNLFDPFMKVCDYSTPGVVEYAMVDDGGAPYTAAAGTLMTVNFEVKGSAPDGMSDITIPFVLLKDENKDEITGVGVTPGTVTVNALVDADSDGYYALPCGNDCDDNDPNVNPGMTEITCNSKDDDCNAATPDSPDGDGDGVGVCDDCDDGDATVWQLLTGYTDGDNDGYGTGAAQDVCSGNNLPTGYATQVGDCDDGDATVWQLLTGYTDNDGDGYGTGSAQQVCSGASLPSGYATQDGDCDDTNAAANPGATEICDGIDNNCDGQIDEGCCACDFCYDLEAGWNFVSVPKKLNDSTDAVTVFNLTLGETCLYYDCVDGWKSNGAVNVVPCQGYWVGKVASDQICLDFDPGTGAINPPEQDLCAGWNMIGHIHTSTMPVDDGSITDFGSITTLEDKFAQIWQWTQSGGWECYPLDGFTDMTPGQGYWILTTEATTMYGTN